MEPLARIPASKCLRYSDFVRAGSRQTEKLPFYMNSKVSVYGQHRMFLNMSGLYIFDLHRTKVL